MWSGNFLVLSTQKSHILAFRRSRQIMHKFCVWFLPVGRHFRLRCTVVIMTAFSSSENPTSGTLLLRIEQVTSVHSIITWRDQAQLTICGGFKAYGGGGIWRLWTNRKSLWKILKKYFLDSPWKREPINGWSQLVAQIFPERENLLHFSILVNWQNSRSFNITSGLKTPFPDRFRSEAAILSWCPEAWTSPSRT